MLFSWGITLCGALAVAPSARGADERGADDSFGLLAGEYEQDVRPLLSEFCLDCHSTEAREGELDLQRFGSLSEIRRDPGTWSVVAEMLDQGEMPPTESPQPTAEQMQQLRQWVRRYLDTEARAGAGDPGPVVLRRLSNAEYTHTIRDLTGVQLDPAREFPVDGAAGEGFTNAGGALVMSPALLGKYLDAGKEIANHAVLLPDGIRFSAGATRRDWTDEIVAEIRAIALRHTSGNGDVSSLDRWDVADPRTATDDDGRVDLARYFDCLVRHRPQLIDDIEAIDAIATDENLNAKYLRHLATMFRSGEPSSLLLNRIRERWRMASPKDAPALAADVRTLQDQLWKFNTVGHFGSVRPWQEAVNPPPEAVGLGSENGDSSPPEGDIYLAAYEDFRHFFPAAMCYARIVPVDEVVTLVLFHREDEHLARLMLDDAERERLDRLWDELHYVSQDAFTSVTVFEQLMEFATQEGDPSLFEPLREPIHQRADEFQQQLEETEPAHLDALVDFAARAYRRPLSDGEADDLRGLYATLRQQGASHEGAIRTTLARVLTSPKFLYRVERPSRASEPAPVSDWELASRLSYFLWASMPDQQLRDAARAGGLHQKETLREHSRRMLKDPRTRRLAVEFACQWLLIRDFDQHDEKSERHFPSFADLRDDMYEESVLFFTDLFQNDRSVLSILAADHTFLNGSLAQHYGITGIEGDRWRRVEGMGEYSRGGILAQATMLAKQSGASRTSPILRGNWVTEVLLGERLPGPPDDVPQLPERIPDGLSERQLIERHSSDAACAGCHARIDPYGFTLERFDAVGRLRDQYEDTGPIDAAATLPDGVHLDGMGGLQDYLLTTRRGDFLRQFCRKLLGYALGCAVQLSDEPLLREMMAKLARNEYRFSVAVETVVTSDQFRKIRGSE